jgi:hypothetical protein
MKIDYERYEQIYKQRAQEKLPEEQILGAWLFYRTGGFASMAAGPLSPLVGVIIRTIGKKRAAGFPNMFLIVVTPTQVRAFKAKSRRTDIKLGDELAVWDRASLKVTVREATINNEVTFESPAEGEKVLCSTGKDRASTAMLALLQEQPAAA